MPYLVRHAHAGDKRAWLGPDAVRPLSAPGRREAHGLLTRLRDYPITRILSSPAVRCRQTVEPLARRRGLPIWPTGELDVHADPAALHRLLQDPAARHAVLCTHGELIDAVLELLPADLLEGDGAPAWPKGSTWVLQVDGGRLRQARYLPPLRLQDVVAGYY
jgi:phosphohistidine phosphatase SixA